MPKLLVQPAFDSRIRRLPSPLGVAIDIQRGQMVWDGKQGSNGLGYTGGPFGDGRDRINFLFNPSTVSSDFNVGNASLQAAMMYPVPGSSTTLLAPLMQTVSWELYFDRNFELAYGTGAAGLGTGQPNDPGVIGCQADVLQFMQFTGLLSDLNTASGVSALTGGTVEGGSTAPISALGSGGIMVMVPCFVYFGNATAVLQDVRNPSVNFDAINYQLAYYGYISEFSVQYTHWTNNMIPIRCVISVNFTMLPQPGSADIQSVLADVTNAPAPGTGPRPTGYVPPPNLTGSTAGTAGIGGR